MNVVDSYTCEILKALSQGTKRYIDLGNACVNESTRSKKLKIMIKEKLIDTAVIETKKRRSIYYKLTQKGRRVLQSMLDI